MVETLSDSAFVSTVKVSLDEGALREWSQNVEARVFPPTFGCNAFA
jgi:hypothetical protein